MRYSFWNVSRYMYLLHKHRKCYPWFLGTCIINPRLWSFFSCDCKNRYEKLDTCRCDYSHFPALKMCQSHTFSASAIPFDLEKDKLSVLWHALITRTKKWKLHDAILTFSTPSHCDKGRNSRMRIATTLRQVVKPFQSLALNIFTEINRKMFLATNIHENYDRQ